MILPGLRYSQSQNLNPHPSQEQVFLHPKKTIFNVHCTVWYIYLYKIISIHYLISMIKINVINLFINRRIIIWWFQGSFKPLARRRRGCPLLWKMYFFYLYKFATWTLKFNIFCKGQGQRVDEILGHLTYQNYITSYL